MQVDFLGSEALEEYGNSGVLEGSRKLLLTSLLG
jgi:hypothetical protein